MEIPSYFWGTGGRKKQWDREEEKGKERELAQNIKVREKRNSGRGKSFPGLGPQARSPYRLAFSVTKYCAACVPMDTTWARSGEDTGEVSVGDALCHSLPATAQRPQTSGPDTTVPPGQRETSAPRALM